MKLFIFALLFPLFALGATPLPSGVNPNQFAVGGMNTTSTLVPPVVTSDGQNSIGWFMLTAYGSGTTGNTTPLLKNGVIYQVPTGKTTRCIGVSGQTAAANSSFQLLYADATFAFDAAPGTLTNPVYEGGAQSRYVHTWYSLVPSQYGIMFDFPATKWPGIQHVSQSNNFYYLICREI